MTDLEEHLHVTVRAELVEHDEAAFLVSSQPHGEVHVC